MSDYESLFPSREETVASARAWASILRRGGSGWLLAVKDLPPVLDALVELVEAQDPAPDPELSVPSRGANGLGGASPEGNDGDTGAGNV